MTTTVAERARPSIGARARTVLVSARRRMFWPAS